MVNDGGAATMDVMATVDTMTGHRADHKTDPDGFLSFGLEGIDPESEQAAELRQRNAEAFLSLIEDGAAAMPYEQWLSYHVWRMAAAGDPRTRAFDEIAEGYYGLVWRPMARVRARIERWHLPERMPVWFPDALWQAATWTVTDSRFRRENLVVRARPSVVGIDTVGADDDDNGDDSGVTVEQAEAEVTMLGLVLCHDEKAMRMVREGGWLWQLMDTQEAAECYIAWWDSTPDDERPFLVKEDEIRDILLTGGVLVDWLDCHMGRVIEYGKARLRTRIARRRASRQAAVRDERTEWS